MQDHGAGLQPIAYLSHKMIPAEKNYPVHEQEQLAIVHALREWRHYLHGAPFKVLTDHRSLQYMHTQPHLSTRQSRWMEFLSTFDFKVEYCEGKKNIIADALSRRADHEEQTSISDGTVATAINTSSVHDASLLEEIANKHTRNDPVL